MTASPIRPAALGALLVLLAGCRTAALPVPDALDAAPLTVERPAVRTPGAELRFGAYAATDVERSWTGRRGARGTRSRAGAARADYAFTLTGDGASLRVTCETHAHDVTVEGGVDVALAAGEALDCTVRDDGDRPHARLRLRGDHGVPLAGTLTAAGASFRVEGTRRLAGGLPGTDTSGYHFFDGERAVGAVETFNAGRVWLADVAPGRRALLAAAAAALLLHEALDADPETAS